MTVQRSVVRGAVASGIVVALLVTGSPAAAVPSGRAAPPPDQPAPTLAELRGGELDGPEPDARRRAEQSGRWDPDRPRPEGTDPVPVAARTGGSRWSPPPPEPPAAGRGALVWPRPGRSVVSVPERGSGTGAAQAGTRPVWVARPAGTRGPAVAAGTEVAVEVLDRATARQHGAAVAVRLHRTGSDAGVAVTGTELVALTVDYSGFGHAAGGDYGSRLRAKAYPPECTRAGSGCRGTPLASDNDPATQTVTATVPVPSGGGTTLVMLTADADGPAGDWEATPLSPSAEWSHGGASGDFAWSYPLRTPELPGGLGPELSVGYSSGSVDGRTLSTNNQTSWLGEGFSLTTGFVERRYVACVNDMGSGANNTKKTGDLCWKADNAVLSLDGSAIELVKDSSTGTWRPKYDDGSRVQRLTGAGNGARNGEYWRVTTRDGTQHYFGRHRRYAGDTAATNSVFTVPVAGNHSGEPCHASSFSASFCNQAWRWNLDYVVDPNGNTMTYFYARESNRYGQNLNDTSVSYHRGGYLQRIEYGQRKGSEHSTPAPGRVRFTVAERCLPGGGVSCQPGELDEGTADKWPDVPYDRICTSSSSCSERLSPTFFSRKRLTQVETQVRVSGSYRPVDRWVFTHKFPDPGDGNSAALWLDRITHSGRAGGTVTLPSVEFAGAAMPNRVPEIDTAPLVNRYRVLAITSETGAVVSADYSAPDCQPGQSMPAPHTNTTRCFPVYWQPEGAEHEDPEVYWFHKYVVDTVTEIDGTGEGVEVERHYSYGGSPAWAYDDDPFVKADYRTWNQWRGYRKVTTRVGNQHTDQLRTERLYLRGMHGDRAGPSGGTRSVTVTDSWGDSVTDHEHFAGMLREEIAYNGSAKVTSTVHDPWRSAVTASGGGEQARMVNIAGTRVHTALAAGGWRTAETRFSYDSHGLRVRTDDRGDVSTTSDDLCVRVQYARNTSRWILDRVKHTETVSKRCSVTPSRPGDVVSAERRSYDGGSFGTAPTRGNVTRTEVLDTWTGGPGYVTTSRASYDAHGRVTSAWDALDRRTTTAYTPATGGPVTNVTVTNPAGHVTVTKLEPLRGVPIRVTDANGRVSEATYDPLGRLRKVWRTDRDRATETPSLEYAYRVSASLPVAVSTTTLLPSGDRTTSVELYDSLLRPRQTQTPAAGDSGGRLVTDTEYDSRGLAIVERGPYYAAGAPSTGLVQPVTTAPRRLLSSYDGAGRVTLERLMVHQSEHSRRVTSYGGDRVHVTPPDGGTATTTINDARGRTTELREYHGPTPSGSYDATTYAHTPTDELASITDPAGNTWTYGYDLRGRRIRVDDPDAGVSTTSYDRAGQVTATTDARGVALAHRYDVLGRRTETRTGSASGELLAAWTYDTLEKGQLTSSTTYHDGAAYTMTVYGYDDAYRPLGETVTIPASEGALAGSHQTYRTYNPDGSLRLHWRPGIGGLPQETLWHHYDAAGKPEWLNGARTYVADTVYSPFGEVEQHSLGVNLGRANWQTYFYEEGTRRLDRMRVDREGYSPADVDRRYRYDPAGNPLSIADTGSPGAADVQCFDYDHRSRLTEAWSQGSGGCAAEPSTGVLGGVAPYWQSYRYDPAGNRTELVAHGVGGAADAVTTYEHPAGGQARPHAVTATSTRTGGGPAAVTSYSYDPAGNPTAKVGPDGTTSYQWDAQGRLDTITTPDGTGGAVYTPDGERLIRRTPTSTTLYIGGDEYTLDHTTGQVSGTRYYQLGGATLVVRTGGGTISSLAAGHKGTPLAVIDDDNAITRRWQDPFGNRRGPQPAGWPGDRGFHTGTQDTWAGLVHMGARPYDPALGQFLTVDPLIRPADSQQIQGYSYANQNPLSYSDPSGLIFMPVDPKVFTKGKTLKQVVTERRNSQPSGQRTQGRSGQDGSGRAVMPPEQRSGSAGGGQPTPLGQSARRLEETIERLVIKSGLFNVCTGTAPDVTGHCQDAAKSVAKLYSAALLQAVCGRDYSSPCDAPVPDYLSVSAGRSASRWFINVSSTTKVTVTRTGKVFASASAGVGLGGSKSEKWGPIDAAAGWVFDGERRASAAQVSSFPKTGLDAEASVSVSALNGQVSFNRGFSTHDSGGLHAVEMPINSVELVNANLGVSVSYGAEVADIGKLW